MNDDPDAKTYRALFICTQNSARSIMAEALLRSLGAGRFDAHSAGSHPRGSIHPGALRALESLGLPTTGLHSKDWNVFSTPGTPAFDFVFTVCDNAAGEACPLWPGQPMTAHWGLPDPAAVQGTEAQCAQAFRDTALALKRRIELMLALPLASLGRLAIQRELRAIGTR